MLVTVPTVPLNAGRPMPTLGFGVYQLDDARAPDLVGRAIRAGYRSIDTAAIYGNEAAARSPRPRLGGTPCSSPRSSGTTARAATRPAAPSTRAWPISGSRMSTST